MIVTTESSCMILTFFSCSFIFKTMRACKNSSTSNQDVFNLFLNREKRPCCFISSNNNRYLWSYTSNTATNMYQNSMRNHWQICSFLLAKRRNVSDNSRTCYTSLASISVWKLFWQPNNCSIISPFFPSTAFPAISLVNSAAGSLRHGRTQRRNSPMQSS